jgi:hypothetical protein
MEHESKWDALTEPWDLLLSLFVAVNAQLAVVFVKICHFKLNLTFLSKFGAWRRAFLIFKKRLSYFLQPQMKLKLRLYKKNWPEQNCDKSILQKFNNMIISDYLFSFANNYLGRVSF